MGWAGGGGVWEKEEKVTGARGSAWGENVHIAAYG